MLAAALDEIAAVSREHTANMNVEITLTERSLPYLGRYLPVPVPTYLPDIPEVRDPDEASCVQEMHPPAHISLQSTHTAPLYFSF